MQDFPRAARMLHASEYGATLKTRPVGRGTYLVLNHHRSEQHTRAILGLIVPKRFLKKAVSRNCVKRVLREAFRHIQHSLPPGSYAFRVHKSLPELSLTEIRALIRADCDVLFARARRIR